MDRLDPLGRDVLDSAYGSDLSIEDMAALANGQEDVIEKRSALMVLHREQRELVQQIKQNPPPKESQAEKLEQVNAQLSLLLDGFVVALKLKSAHVPAQAGGD